MNNISVLDILKYGDKGIVAIINHEDKKVFIAYTRNLVEFFCLHLKYLKAGTHYIPEMQKDKDKLIVVMLRNLDSYTDHTLGKYLLKGYKDYLNNHGYTLYNDIKELILIPQIKIESVNFGRGYRAVVYLYNKRNKRLRIKEFKIVDDAQNYINTTPIESMIIETTLKQ